MKDKTILTCVVAGCATWLGTVALMSGHDGVILIMLLSGLFGMIGVVIPRPDFLKD